VRDEEVRRGGNQRQDIALCAISHAGTPTGAGRS
jgi:hypothetical protein